LTHCSSPHQVIKVSFFSASPGATNQGKEEKEEKKEKKKKTPRKLGEKKLQERARQTNGGGVR